MEVCKNLYLYRYSYFSRGNLYGISVFQNLPTNVDRGAHMKAIGLIVQPTESTGLCGQIWSHQEYLKKELRYYLFICEKCKNITYKIPAITW